MGLFDKLKEKLGKSKADTPKNDISRPQHKNKGEEQVSFEIPEFSQEDLDFDLSLDEFLPQDNDKVTSTKEEIKEANLEPIDLNKKPEIESVKEETTHLTQERVAKQTQINPQTTENDEQELESKEIDNQINITQQEINKNTQELEEQEKPVAESTSSSSEELPKFEENEDFNTDINIDTNKELIKLDSKKEELNTDMDKELPGFEIFKSDLKEKININTYEENLPGFEELSRNISEVFVNGTNFKKIVISKNIILDKFIQKEEFFETMHSICLDQEENYKYIGKEIDGIQHDLLYIDEDIFGEG